MIKGALHIHSNISKDSSLSRIEIRNLFKEAGYSFVMLAEHSEDLDESKYSLISAEYSRFSDKDFIMIPGIEIKWKDRVHFLAYGAKKYMANVDDMPIEETIKAIRNKTQCEILVWGHYGHPELTDPGFMRASRHTDGVEVFNAMYHGSIMPCYKGLKFLNSADNDAIVAFGGLDMHERRLCGRISCEIALLDKVTREGIFSHLKSGKFVSKGRIFNLRQPRYSTVTVAVAYFVTIFHDYYRRLKRKVRALLWKQ